MPTIGIDYTPAYEQGAGIGRYVRDLIGALANEDEQTPYHLFVAGASRNVLPPAPGSNFHWTPTRLTPRWCARLWHRLHIPLPIEYFTGDIDLYHATDFVLPPTRKSTHTILQVHDLSFVRVPEAASPNLKAYLDRVVPDSVNRADHVLADSRATKSDLCQLYNIAENKITVLHGGVDPHFKPVQNAVIQAVRHKYDLGSVPFVLSVGTVQPRKNYSRLISAVAQLREHHPDIRLVIAGGRGWLEGPIYDTLNAVSMEPYTHFIGFVDDTDLPALYNAAACFAFPSLYEGFGLPVLEAMACGTPVVTANVSSLPEAAGDAALLVDPYDVDAIASALENVLTASSLRNQMINRGFQHIQNFTWQSAARKLLKIYKDML